MESLILVIGFIIVFGGIGYAVLDSINHFKTEVHK